MYDYGAKDDLIASIAYWFSQGNEVLPIMGFKNGMEKVVLVGWCFYKNEAERYFVDEEIHEELRHYLDGIAEFVDLGLWETQVECLLYHGLAIVANRKVQECAQEFGWMEAFMAAYRGQYNSHQEWAHDPFGQESEH